MRRVGFAAAAAATLASSAVGQTVPATPSASYTLVTYAPPGAQVRCAEGSARVVDAPAPPATVATEYKSVPPPALIGSPPGPPPPLMIPPVSDRPLTPDRTYRFNISAQGRVGGLQREDLPGPAMYETDDHQVQATLAAWRFAPGEAWTGCRYLAAKRRTPLEEADRTALLRLMATTRPGGWREMVAKRAQSPGSDCMRDRPDPRLQAYPAYDELPVTPGRRQWVWLGYDLDAAGAPQRIRVLSSSGDAALDAAGVEALRRSHYEPGVRTGCMYSYWRNATPLPAPPRPDIKAFVRPGDDCPNIENRTRIKFVDGDRFYPPAFRERNINGWALVRFDVAPWGEIRPTEVVAAEPAAAFGQAAQAVVRSARAEPGTGWRGCLQPIAFTVSEEDVETEADLRLR